MWANWVNARWTLRHLKAAYPLEELIERKVVVVANLAPRKMRFGLSEGMVLAAGPGGADIFLLSPDAALNRGCASSENRPMGDIRHSVGTILVTNFLLTRFLGCARSWGSSELRGGHRHVAGDRVRADAVVGRPICCTVRPRAAQLEYLRTISSAWSSRPASSSPRSWCAA